MTKTELREVPLRNTEDLCKLVGEIGYGSSRFAQLQNSNGSFVSWLTDFLDDNPGAIEAIREFIIEHEDSYTFEEEAEEEDTDDDE